MNPFDDDRYSPHVRRTTRSCGWDGESPLITGGIRLRVPIIIGYDNRTGLGVRPGKRILSERDKSLDPQTDSSVVAQVDAEGVTIRFGYLRASNRGFEIQP